MSDLLHRPVLLIVALVLSTVGTVPFVGWTWAIILNVAMLPLAAVLGVVVGFVAGKARDRS
jgi:uncharacterized integral membrane protein